MINLKSEIEIRFLHKKLDYLIIHQQLELLEIQRAQMEMMDEFLESISKNKGKVQRAMCEDKVESK